MDLNATNMENVLVFTSPFSAKFWAFFESEWLSLNMEGWRLNEPNLSLIHWGRVTHICGGNLTIIGSDNGLSPDRRQTIIWTNAGILSIGALGMNFSELLIEI